MCQSVGVLVEGLRPLTGSIVAVILGIFGKSASDEFPDGNLHNVKQCSQATGGPTRTWTK
jgi:hypothetical protein